jgi:hypothetical protein
MEREQADPGSEAVRAMNLRIAELLRNARPEEIVEILIAPETSLIRPSQQQQQQQQQTRKATLE